MPANIFWQELQTGSIIGRGSFGDVYAGIYNNFPVAIKLLHLKTLPLNSHFSEDFYKEVRIMRECQSENIIQLHGICTEPGRLSIIMEHMAGGSLNSLLHNNQEELTEYQKCQLAIDIASGLTYLHDEKDIIHGDLKSNNILLESSKNHAKITDFGLSSLRLEISSSNALPSGHAAGTVRWKAPELFARKVRGTKASDIYSYGMILWEIIARRIPFAEEPNEQIVIDWIKNGKKENIPDNCPEKLREIINSCWLPAAERPLISEILNTLKEQNNLLASNLCQQAVAENATASQEFNNGNYQQAVPLLSGSGCHQQQCNQNATQAENNLRTSNLGDKEKRTNTSEMQEFNIVSYNEDSFLRLEVAADGDCGFTAFGITRSEAFKLLVEGVFINEIVKSLIQQPLREAMFTKNFRDYVQQQNIFLNYVETFDNYTIAQVHNDIAQANNFHSILNSYLDDLNFLQLYINYDVRDKKVDCGWAHPAILQSLAEIRNLKLNIFIMEGDFLITPHSIYSNYTPIESANVSQEVSLLFINGNHFERLEKLSKEPILEFIDQEQKLISKLKHKREVADMEFKKGNFEMARYNYELAKELLQGLIKSDIHLINTNYYEQEKSKITYNIKLCKVFIEHGQIIKNIEESFNKDSKYEDDDKNELILQLIDEALTKDKYKGGYLAKMLALKGEILIDLKKYDLAVNIIKDAFGLSEHDVATMTGLQLLLADIYYKKGTSQFTQSRFEAALENFSLAVNYDNNFEYYYYKALTLNKLKRYEEAIAAAEKAFQLNRDSIEIKEVLACAYLDLGVKLFKESESSRQEPSILQEKKDKYRKALDNLDTAKKYINDNSGNYYRLYVSISMVCNKLGYASMAISAAEQAIEKASRLNRNYEAAKRELSKAKLKKQQISKAIIFHNEVGFIRLKVASDGDCGFTAFGITREQAFQLLIENISNPKVEKLLKQPLGEAIVDKKFRDYIEENNIFPEYIKFFDERIVAQQVHNTLEAENLEKKLKIYSNDSEFLLYYIYYDVRDKKVDAGWAHPAVLQALAEIRDLRLNIFTINEDSLSPHTIYPTYNESAEQEVNLLFTNGNHFERLEHYDNQKEIITKRPGLIREIEKDSTLKEQQKIWENAADLCIPLEILEPSEVRLYKTSQAIKSLEQQATSSNQMQPILNIFSNRNVNIPVKSLLGKSELEEIVELLKAKRIGIVVKKLYNYLINQKLSIDEVDMNEILAEFNRVNATDLNERLLRLERFIQNEMRDEDASLGGSSGSYRQRSRDPSADPFREIEREFIFQIAMRSKFKFDLGSNSQNVLLALMNDYPLETAEDTAKISRITPNIN